MSSVVAVSHQETKFSLHDFSQSVRKTSIRKCWFAQFAVCFFIWEPQVGTSHSAPTHRVNQRGGEHCPGIWAAPWGDVFNQELWTPSALIALHLKTLRKLVILSRAYTHRHLVSISVWSHLVEKRAKTPCLPLLISPSISISTDSRGLDVVSRPAEESRSHRYVSILMCCAALYSVLPCISLPHSSPKPHRLGSGSNTQAENVREERVGVGGGTIVGLKEGREPGAKTNGMQKPRQGRARSESSASRGSRCINITLKSQAQWEEDTQPKGQWRQCSAMGMRISLKLLTPVTGYFTLRDRVNGIIKEE